MTATTSSIWPTHRQEALLRLVLGPREEVATRWAALQPFVLDELDPGTFCLLPLLHTRLAEAGVDDPNSERIAGTYRAVWFRNQIALRRLAEILPVLGANGVDAVVFGGASIASRFYEQAGHRPLSQLDLIVGPEDIDAARAVVEERGEWRARLERADYVRFEDSERLVVVLHVGLPPPVAVGRRNPVYGRAEEILLDATAMRVLAPADELVVACGLGARLIVPPSIQWLVDAAVVSRSERLAPADVVASAVEFHLVSATRDAIRYLRRVVPASPLDRLAAALDAVRPSRRDALAHRFGTRPERVSQRLSSYLRSLVGPG